MGAATISSRAYFSGYHLWSAENKLKRIKELEDQFNGRSHFDIEHRTDVIGCILSSVAFLEALINELFQDVADGHTSHLTEKGADTAELMSTIWEEIEESPLLNKFQMALFCYKQPLFDAGKAPLQDVSLIIKIRNNLVHYKPKSLSIDSIHKLEPKLRGKFSENKLMAGTGNNFYPDKCLGYGCAEWVVSGSKKLAAEFFNKIGTVPRYQKYDWNK